VENIWDCASFFQLLKLERIRRRISFAREEARQNIVENRFTTTRLVYVANREADLMFLMLRAEELDTPADWLVLSVHNRCLPKGGRRAVGLNDNLSFVGDITFTIASRHGVKELSVGQGHTMLIYSSVRATPSPSLV
jgi:hypothetical protein